MMVRCRCGQLTQAPDGMGGKETTCSACGRSVAIDYAIGEGPPNCPSYKTINLEFNDDDGDRTIRPIQLPRKLDSPPK